MAAADIFRHRVRIALDARLSPQQIGVVAGALARARHEELISQRLVSSSFRLFVDGKEGVPEELINLVRPGGGRIRYVGTNIAEAVAYCFTYCREFSPILTGAFKAAWLIVVDGAPLLGPIEQIPPNAQEILITNFAPYARRLEQTAGRVRPQYRITEAAAQATKRKFPGMKVARKFVAIPAGATNGKWPVPYHRKTAPQVTILYPAVQIQLR